MKNGKAWIGALLVVAVGAIALGGAWYLRQRRAAGHCAFCLRPVHVRTVAERDGKRQEACCPACVLALRAQTHANVRIISVADYDTHRDLAPDQAAYVVGSDVHTCAGQPAVKVDESKRPLPLHYDRCEPSILAFASRERATAFVKEHGGNIATLRDLGMGMR